MGLALLQVSRAFLAAEDLDGNCSLSLSIHRHSGVQILTMPYPHCQSVCLQEYLSGKRVHMNLGGFALLLTAVFASGSGVHAPAVPGAHTLAARSAASHSQSSADPAPPVAQWHTGTLTQAGPGTWQVTVLMDDSGAKCAGAMASVAYRLKFTIPGGAATTPLSGTATPVPLQPPPPTGSSCEITIKFTNLNQVPITATLDLDQGGASSAITLTVSRTVTLYYYLGIPAVVGGIMVIIMLLAVLRYVRLYTADGRRVRWREHAYWVRPLSAAGAWTINDSWATNITTVITLLATILGTTTASSALFPGRARPVRDR